MPVTVVGELDSSAESLLIKEAVIQNYKRDDIYWVVVGDDYCQVSHTAETLSHDEFWSQSPRKLTINGKKTYMAVVFFDMTTV